MSVRKSTIIAGVAVAASLIVLGIGIAKARLHYMANAKTSTSAHEATAAPDVPSSADSSSIQSIRFASNPQIAPPFLVNDITGNIISTAGWHGKVVLLNFWATWCPPCREEIPALIRLQSEYKDRLQIIGVAMDDAVDEKAVDRYFVKQAVRNQLSGRDGKSRADCGIWRSAGAAHFLRRESRWARNGSKTYRGSARACRV